MTYGIGGATTVRGWPTGARQGKKQWLNTLEYRYQWVKPRPIKLFGKFNVYWGLHLAIYGDLGTAWTAPPDFSRNFIGGVGYGIRLIIPYVGMILSTVLTAAASDLPTASASALTCGAGVSAELKRHG